MSYNRHTFLAAEYRRLRDALLAEFPELTEDEQTLADTLEGESELPDIISLLIREARKDKAMADALATMIQESQERKQRFLYRAEKRRMTAMGLMNAVGLRKLEQPDFTASIRSVGSKIEITDDASIPDAFCRVVKTPDKTAIKAALERGEKVSGAVLGNGGETLSVRVK